MQAIILNSGVGSRLGSYTENKPKCMVELEFGETILSRQLRLLCEAGVKDIVITTGYLHEKLMAYVKSLPFDLNYTWVHSEAYLQTNYIVSLDKVEDVEEDVLLFHGDLVFSEEVLERLLECKESSVVVDSNMPLPEKDFKAKLKDGRIDKIGISYFGEDCVALQPFYHLKKHEWLLWKNEIRSFCESGKVKVYAEEAYNNQSELAIKPLDINGKMCGEIDNEQDLINMRKWLKENE